MTADNRLDEDAPPGALIGIDIGGTKIDVAVAVGDSRRTTRLATEADSGAAQAVERAFSAAASLAGGQRPAAVGVSVPGAVDNGVISLADNLPGLNGLELTDAAAKTFPDTPLALVNDLNAAATAQLAAGIVPQRGVGVVIGLGTGTAAGIIVDGLLRPGARGTAGEIGYSRVHLPGADAAMPLEDVAGGRALDRLAAARGLSGARALLDHAETDAATARVVLPRLDAVGHAIAFCQHVLDPDALVVFGGLSAHRLLRRRVEAVLAAEVPEPPAVRWLAPHDNASLEGALVRARMLTESRVPA